MWDLETLKRLNKEREQYLLDKKAQKDAIRKSVESLKGTTESKGR